MPTTTQGAEESYLTVGDFHYAKDSGNFGRNSNGKVRFGFFRPEYSGSDLWRSSTYFGRPTEIRRSIFDPFLINRFFALRIRKFGIGIESGKSHSYRLARFNREMSFHFPRVFPLISDRSVWHNGSTAYFQLNSPYNCTCSANRSVVDSNHCT